MPLPRWLTLCGRGTHACACGVCTCLLWTLWLVLVIALGVQLVIASVREVAVPGFVLRQLEERLASAGLRAEFGQARFDPGGHVLLRDVSVVLGAPAEPVLRAEAILLQVEPWALLVRDLRVRSVQISGGELLVPAMFSPSGRNEPLVQAIDVRLEPGGRRREFVLHQLTARAGGIALRARGRLAAPPPGRSPTPPQEWLAKVAALYPRVTGQLAHQLAQLPAMSAPRISLELQPERLVGTLQVADLELPPRLSRWNEALRLDALDAHVQLPFADDFKPRRITATVAVDTVAGERLGRWEGVRLAGGAAREPTGRWRPGRVQLTAAQVHTPHGSLRLPVVSATLDRWPAIEASLAGSAFGARWSFRGTGRADERTAELDFDGAVTPELIDWVGQRVGRDLTALVSAASPPRVGGSVAFQAGAKPTAANVRIETGPVVARTVALDATSGELRWDGRELAFEDIVLRTGRSEARGRYAMDPRTKAFRFLLNGRLEPTAINGWFREWWSQFWEKFEFTDEPAAADVDVRGRWGEPRRTAVFVAADGVRTRLQGADFDRIRTRLFVRPGFVDVIEFIGDRGGRSARGGFTRRWQPGAPGWRSLAFDVRGNTDLAPAPALFGQLGATITRPFAFAEPPALHVRGRLERDAEGAPVRADVRIDGEGAGDWTFHQFPLHDLRFAAHLKDGTLRIEHLATGFAGGRATGQVELQGLQGERRLKFDVALDDARLGESIRTLETWSAARKGEPPAPVSRFQQQVAPGMLDLSLAAAGRYDDPYSLLGDGRAVITGAELGEINLLGILSALLRRTIFNFTTLRLDRAEADFALAGRLLQFRELRLSGNRAAIEAEGNYALDTKQLDVQAKILPFDASEGFLSTTVGAFLTPLSHVLEVKLGGRLDQPNWVFVYGPTSLLRAITGDPVRPPAAPPPVRRDP